MSQGEKLENLKVLRKEMKKISRKQQMAVVMTHESFPEAELYCCMCYAKVTTEGPSDYFYDVPVTNSEPLRAPAAQIDRQNELP